MPAEHLLWTNVYLPLPEPSPELGASISDSHFIDEERTLMQVKCFAHGSRAGGLNDSQVQARSSPASEARCGMCLRAARGTGRWSLHSHGHGSGWVALSHVWG